MYFATKRNPFLDQKKMVATQLTPELIKDGAELLAKLDASGHSPEAALWMYSSERGGWRLILVDRKLGTEGRRPIYKVVQKALHALRDTVVHLSFFNVSLAKPEAPFVKALRKAFPRRRAKSGMRLTYNYFGGNLIEDAYIYRLHRPAA